MQMMEINDQHQYQWNRENNFFLSLFAHETKSDFNTVKNENI